ncbi:hypothetical protein QL285_031953 [Trifolium repens]|nr:hypothetical protein QL285_031953 [Trifolium repens]
MPQDILESYQCDKQRARKRGKAQWRCCSLISARSTSRHWPRKRTPDMTYKVCSSCLKAQFKFFISPRQLVMPSIAFTFVMKN